MFTPNGKDGKPFETIVPRTFGALTFTHNVPVHSTKLIQTSRDRVTGDDDDPNRYTDVLAQWLTEDRETDCYGVVALPVDLDITSVLTDIAGMDDEKGAKVYKDMKKGLMSQMKDGMATARERADERVKRQLMLTHRNVLQVMERLKIEGKGTYVPSLCEMLGTIVLRTELDKIEGPRREMLSRFDENMKKTMGI